MAADRMEMASSTAPDIASIRTYIAKETCIKNNSTKKGDTKYTVYVT